MQNIRSIPRINWTVPRDKSPGWHVIIGDNGAGKSTLLRSIALALVGPTEAAALRQDWDEWLAKGRSHGYVSIELCCDWHWDRWSGKGNTPTYPYLPVRAAFARNGDEVRIYYPKTKPSPDRYIWGSGGGWFSASYGPFRRFAGGTRKFFTQTPGWLLIFRYSARVSRSRNL